jgi:hypothetical protein
MGPVEPLDVNGGPDEEWLSDDEYDAACILQLPDRVPSARSVYLGDEAADWTYADENPDAWKLVEERESPKRVTELRALAIDARTPHRSLDGL